ncbi:unnamed protein product [Gongylonema pulchrum]|uniref:Secreted protein n=1 Tax=Gongylonema pulchrum TaxID=637853 RepID=A0A183DI66_9BILA|nr:unnamed protein product [Gongylonema pulchrum]
MSMKKFDTVITSCAITKLMAPLIRCSMSLIYRYGVRIVTMGTSINSSTGNMIGRILVISTGRCEFCAGRYRNNDGWNSIKILNL